MVRQLVIGSRGRPRLRIESQLAAELDAGALPPAAYVSSPAASAGAPAGTVVPLISVAAAPDGTAAATVSAVAAPADTAAPTMMAVPAVAAAPTVVAIDAVAPVDAVAPTVAAAPIDPAAPAPPAPAVPPTITRRRPSEITESELIHALQVSEWSLKAAADHLGIARASIYDVIGRFPSVRTASDLTPAEIELCHCECGGDLDRMVARLCVSRRALGRRVKELGLAIAKR